MDIYVRHNRYSPLTVSGLLLFSAGFIIFMGIITAEMLYTLKFSTRENYISELAAALPQGTLTPQPSALIFNLSMIASGLALIVGTFFILGATRKLISCMPLFLFGTGLVGVGIFPGDVTPLHGIFANIIFLSGGVGSILSFAIVKSPLRIIFIFIGVVSLFFLFAYQYMLPFFGVGGAERWVFYPLVFWITGLGAYQLGMNDRAVNN